MANLRIAAALSGSLSEIIEAERAAIREAHGRAAAATSEELKQALRQHVLANLAGRGLGRIGGRPRRVANAIRAQRYEDGNALVYSKFLKKVPGQGLVDLFTVFIEGATLRPREGEYLFIARDPAVRRALPAVRRDLLSQKGVRLVRTRRGSLMLVKETRTRGTILAFLVRRVRIEPRLKVDPFIDQAAGRLADRFIEELDTE